MPFAAVKLGAKWSYMPAPVISVWKLLIDSSMIINNGPIARVEVLANVSNTS
jgi:hypothetical protein